VEKCYLCGGTLTKNNASVEHIIPNALGGHLKSNALICKNCNNKYGDKYDSKLIQELDFYSTYLLIKRDTGKIQPVILIDPRTEEEYKVFPTGEVSRMEPKVNIINTGNKLSFKIEARDINEEKKILYGISAKYGNFDTAPFIENANISTENLSGPLYKYSKIGDQDMLLSVLKTAVNYFILKTESPQNIENAITELKNGSTKIVEPVALDKRIFPLEDNEVTHSIYINGKKNGKLYMVVEYFNVFQFVVKLNENYIGNDIEDIYIFDVIQRKELSRNINNPYSAEYIFRLNRSDFDLLALNNSRSRFNKIADERRFQYTIEKIVHSVWNNVIEKNVGENEIIPKDIIDLFLKQISKEIREFLIHVYEYKQNNLLCRLWQDG